MTTANYAITTEQQIVHTDECGNRRIATVPNDDWHDLILLIGVIAASDQVIDYRPGTVERLGDLVLRLAHTYWED